MTTGELKVHAERAADKAESAAGSPILELGARLGYVIRGVLYGMMGVLAFQIAAGTGGQATDQKGSLIVLAGNPYRLPILVTAAAGLAAYSLWGFTRALFDPLRRGSDAKGIVGRLGFVWSGLAYGALCVFTLQFIAGSSFAQQGDSTQKAVAQILAQPAGSWLTIAFGLIAIAAGIGQFVEAYKADFEKDLKEHQMGAFERRAVELLGRMGMFSRGVVFTLVGIFLVQAGLHHDASRSHGFGGAFQALVAQPFGHVMLGLVALGFVALGLHSLAAARYMKMFPG